MKIKLNYTYASYTSSLEKKKKEQQFDKAKERAATSCQTVRNMIFVGCLW